MATTKRPRDKQPREKQRKLAAEELFEYAVKSLTIRSYSVADLTAKLRLRAARLSDIDLIVARLTDVGYLDDRRFAESYASNRVANDGFGRMRILTGLASHRVPREFAQSAVEKALEGTSEAEQIEAFIERRLGSAEFTDEKKLASAFRKLRRAGFATGPVLTALKRRAKNAELVEEDYPLEDE
jgi:regulatory protein